MPRSSGGLIATDIQQEVVSLARIMKVVRKGDQLTMRITDHDENILIPSETVRATSHFELCFTDVPGPGGTGGVGPRPAEGYLSLTGLPLNTETLTIGSRVYTFVNALATSGHVKIAATVPLTLANLRQAIIGGSGGGTAYHASTAVNTDVTAEVTDITLPDPLQATLLATGKIASYFSNFTTNSGNWHDGVLDMNNPDQPKTTDQTQGMWAGVVLNTPTSIVYAKIYTTQLWQTHTLFNVDHACGWWFGPDGHIHHDMGEIMMGNDGFTWATG